MELANTIKETWRKELIIKSIIWNTIISEFLKYKNIDITSYLTSIRLKTNIVFVKTNNPLINSEILLIEREIKDLSSKKISKLWLKFWDFEIKFS